MLKRKTKKAGNKRRAQIENEEKKTIVRVESDASDADDANLEELVLGSGPEFLKTFPATSKQVESSDDEPPEETGTTEEAAKKPVWIDEDDEKEIRVPVYELKPGYAKRKLKGLEKTTGAEYQKRLKGNFEKISSLTDPSWAQLKKPNKIRFKDSDESSADEEESDAWSLTKRTGNYVASSAFLPRDILLHKRLKDATFGYRIKKPLKCVEFHKEQPLLLITGHTQKVALMKLEEEGTSQVQAAAFDRFPIDCAGFAKDGNSVILTSASHSHFFQYNLLKGNVVKISALRNIEGPGLPIGPAKFSLSHDGQYMAVVGLNGRVHLLSAKTFEWIGSVQASKSVSSLCFSPLNSQELFSHGEDGEVYVWDVGSRDVVHKFMDYGCVRGSGLAISPNGKLLATGQNTGVVNLYETDAVRTAKEPKPVKSFMNLVTATNVLQFSPTSEILAMASSDKENAIKLAHVKSRTVFSNFPEKGTGFTKINAMAFSPHSGYFSAANDEGRAHLMRLHHYEKL